MSVELGREQGPLDESLRALARILFAGRSSEATLGTVAELARRTIPGCDSASVTVTENGKPRTTSSTDDVATAIDRRQYAGDDGPCLLAIRTHTAVRVDCFDDESRWPGFVPIVLQEGIHSSLSLPLIALDEPVGALNLYSRDKEGFAQAVPLGQVFAAQAAVTVANATAYHRATDLARNLEIALEHRDVIGQAKGILMAKEALSPELAFEILRRASQRSNRKVHDLAADLVARHTERRTQ